MATQPNVKIASQRILATATVTTSTDGLSDVIDLGGACLASIETSTVGWTAASMTFRGSNQSSAAMRDVYYNGSELTFTTTASQAMTFPLENLAGLRFIQLRSGTAAAPVAQGAARTVVLGCMPLGPIK